MIFDDFDVTSKGGFRLLEAELRSGPKKPDSLWAWFKKKLSLRAFCPTGEGNGVDNSCSSEEGGGSLAEATKEKSFDSGRTVSDVDKEARELAKKDAKEHPPRVPGAVSDLWARQPVTRVAKKGTKFGKVESDVIPEEGKNHNGTYYTVPAVGTYLIGRGEEARRAVGGEGDLAIIDLSDPDNEPTEEQKDFVADAMYEDATHAYEELGVNPGFYSTDLSEAMSTMAKLHPELDEDEESQFMFKMILAITSNGASPDQNIAAAEGLYRMWKKSGGKEGGTVVPSGKPARVSVESLQRLQSALDTFGLKKTMNLMRGVAKKGNIEAVLAKLSKKPEGSWERPTDGKGKPAPFIDGEKVGERVPVASLFGPKIGAFFSNLTGKHEFLTMDRWFMRTVGRITGDLVSRTNTETVTKRAKSALKAIQSASWRNEMFFGVDKEYGIKKSDLIKSLKIQAETGVVEESGAAYLWARAAERAHQKTESDTGGQYGTHKDRDIAELHRTGNAIFKSKFEEEQAPKSGGHRVRLREIFRKVQDRFERDGKPRPPADEIQAALWQYEKRLWKMLGAFTKIEENSLFSASAQMLVDKKIDRRDYTPKKSAASRKKSSKKKTADKRSLPPVSENWGGDIFPPRDGYLEDEQKVWDFETSDIDIVEVLKELEEEIETRNRIQDIAAQVGLSMEEIERRAFCPTGEGGGIKNDCSSEEGGGGVERQLALWEDIGYSLPFGTRSDAVQKVSVIESGDRKIPFVDRTHQGTQDYLDEIETSGRERGLAVTFDEAKELQEYSGVEEEDYGPYPAFVRSGYVYLTDNGNGAESESDDTIDENGIEYGTIPPQDAAEMIQQRKYEILGELWDNASKLELVREYQGTMDTDSARDAGFSLPRNIEEIKKYYEVPEDLADDEVENWIDENEEDIFDQWVSLNHSTVAEAWAEKNEDWLKEKFMDYEADGAESQASEEIEEERREARENAIPMMKKDLEEALAATRLSCCIQLYRGLTISSTEIEEIIKDGKITHSSANSWTTSRATARGFGAVRVLLVLRNPKTGHVYQADHSGEREVTRPPAENKIHAVVKTNTGYILYLDEDPEYIDEDEK